MVAMMPLIDDKSVSADLTANIKLIYAEQINSLNRTVSRAFKNAFKVFTACLRNKSRIQGPYTTSRTVQNVKTIPSVFYDTQIFGKLM